ncbi:pyrroline-5-carboxylate reductase dimerization-domain-containing protein [Diaporthe sp. PMI_573]|nr:pyrroline-5-carboxylate reductase dimerization-domain-containing protein [Diaporthaceae sp. PMI_573]
MSELGTLRSPRTVAIIGCGKLGTAIVEGILNAAIDGHQIEHLILTAGSEGGVDCLAAKFGGNKTPKITILHASQNGHAVELANHVILACKHVVFRQVLREEGLHRALTTSSETRVLINIMGGVTSSEIEQILYHQDDTSTRSSAPETKPLIIMRAMPNIAARLNQSTTPLAFGEGVNHDGREELAAAKAGVEAIFGLVGTVQWLPERLMNTASALCASSLAFYASLIEGMATGAQSTDTDMEPEVALALAANAARSTAALLLDDTSPAELRRMVTTKGGSTAKGQAVMDEREVQLAVAEASKTTALAAKQLTKTAE